jgi:hypothetical protein
LRQDEIIAPPVEHDLIAGVVATGEAPLRIIAPDRLWSSR